MAFKGQDLIDGVYDNGVSYDGVLLYSGYLLVRFLSYLMFIIILSDPQNNINLIMINKNSFDILYVFLTELFNMIRF